MSKCHWCDGKGYYTVNSNVVICGRCNMPKLAAGGTQDSEAIIRVDVEPQMLNEKNEDGSYKYTDDQLREWLHKLRGDREVAQAKASTPKTGTSSSPTKPPPSAQDMTDE